MTTTRTIDPRLDLLLTRAIDIPASAAWRGWTEPELIKQWFTPAPWKTVDCEIDLRPGDRCRYTAIAMHQDEAGAKAHAQMGFHQGWGGEEGQSRPSWKPASRSCFE